MPATDTSIPQAGKRVAKRANQLDKSPRRTVDETTVKRGAIYARYSVQEDGKLTDHKQIADCKARAASNGIDVSADRMYVDKGRSAGGDVRRPEWERLLDDMRAGRIDVVLVAKLDRFTRSLDDFVAVRREMQMLNVELISLSENFDTTTAMGQAMQDLVIVFAKLELAMISERNAGIAKFRRDNNMIPAGVPPYGYRKVGVGGEAKYVIDKAEAKVVRGMVSAIMRGQSLRQVTASLIANNVPISRGVAARAEKAGKRGSWTYQQVRRILTGPAIAGLRDEIGTDQFMAAPWDAIVPVDEWQAMLDELAAAGRKVMGLRKQNDGKVNLLSGILRCGRCGHGMRPKRYHQGETLRYCCTSATNLNACGGLSVKAADAEAHVIAELFDALRGRRLAPLTFRDDERAAEIERELDELDQAYQRTGPGSITFAQWQKFRAAREAELATVEAEATIDRRASTLVKLVGKEIDVPTAWDAIDDDGAPMIDMETKRAVIREVFPLITVRDNSGRGGRVPIADRLNIADTVQAVTS